jgi:Tol biopolymer transport system component
VSAPLSSISIAPPAQPRKRARTLPSIALALATFASAGLFNTAHATYPGENGVIIFQSFGYAGATHSIMRVSPDNGTLTFLAAGSSPSVSPNGKKIAYLSDNTQRLNVMDIDGSNAIELVNDQRLFTPAWLPDGSKIVFGRKNTDSKVELWSINPDGSGKTFKRNLDPYTSTANYLELAWSPSSTMYTFSGADNYGIDALYVADDVNPTVLLFASGVASSWAPDGRSILYADYHHNQFEYGPHDTRPVPPGDVSLAASAISPDGKFIAGGLYTTGHAQPPLLTTRARAGTPTTFTWEAAGYKTDWTRVPKNCYATTTGTPPGGGILAGDENFYASQCAIAVMPDGGQHGVMQQAIAVGPDQRLYHRALLSGDVPAWTRFAVVPGGASNPLGIKPKKIAIAGAKDGSAQVVIVNAADDLVYHTMRKADGSWTGFVPLSGWAGAAHFAARDVAITINASSPTTPGNAQVIANGLADGDVFHRVRWMDGSWSPFAGVPSPAGVKSQELAIAADESGYTDIVISRPWGAEPQGQIAHILRDASGNWGNWGSVPTPGVWVSQYSDVAVTRTLNGKAQLVFTDGAGNVLFQERSNPNSFDSWKKEMASKPIIGATGRTVSISAGVNAYAASEILLTRTYPQ